jgi:hypothetical protein
MWRLERIERAVESRVEEAAPTLAHLELNPDHVLFHGDRVTFIDLDSFATADPMIDVASLRARLARIEEQYPSHAERSAAVGEEFERTYSKLVPPAWFRTLPVHRVSGFASAALECLQDQEPGWQRTVTSLVTRADIAAHQVTA